VLTHDLVVLKASCISSLRPHAVVAPNTNVLTHDLVVLKASCISSLRPHAVVAPNTNVLTHDLVGISAADVLYNLSVYVHFLCFHLFNTLAFHLGMERVMRVCIGRCMPALTYH
jgi:hypothetical protein